MQRRPRQRATDRVGARLAAGLRRPLAPPPLADYSHAARTLIRRLRTPEQVQRWLDRLPYNWEKGGETSRTLEGVLEHGRAHCLEAALAAAAILEHHGHPPLLMDLESIDQLDHVVFVFRRNGRYGTVARSRDPGLHGRKPVYNSLYTLVRSYAATYIDLTGRIRGYGVLDLRTLDVDWRRSRRNVWRVVKELIEHPHRRFAVSDAYYERWHRRYIAFKEKHPHEKPVFYPNRRHWLGAHALP
jgi:hypothetical protein